MRRLDDVVLAAADELLLLLRKAPPQNEHQILPRLGQVCDRGVRERLPLSEFIPLSL